jgi:hypothetical protein
MGVVLIVWGLYFILCNKVCFANTPYNFANIYSLRFMWPFAFIVIFIPYMFLRGKIVKEHETWVVPLRLGSVFAPLGILLMGCLPLFTADVVGYVLLVLFSFVPVPPTVDADGLNRISSKFVIARFLRLGVAMLIYVLLQFLSGMFCRPC